MAIATSTIKLWKNVVLTPDKNYAIDDIEDYLGAADSTITDFQFLELKDEMTIKIVLSQYNLQFDSSYNINYCHISRQEEENFSDDDGAYYFIKKMTWKGVDTIELDLEMDVLNTLRYDEDYSVSDKTLVKRQHKTRFEPTERYTKTYIPNCEYTTITKTLVNAPEYAVLSYTSTFPVPPGTNLVPGSAAITAEQKEIFDNYDVQYEMEVYIDGSIVEEYGEFIVKITLGGISTGVVPYVTGAIKVASRYGGSSGYIIIKPYYMKLNPITRKIDLKSEDISAPVYKTKEETLYENEGYITDSWVLYYKNADIAKENFPIDCYLLPYEKREILYPTQDGVISTAEIPSGEYIILSPSFCNGITLNAGGTRYTVSQNIPGGAFSENQYIILAIKNDSGTLKLYRGRFRQSVSFGTPSSTIYISGTEEPVYNFQTALYSGATISVENVSSQLPVERVTSLKTTYERSDSDWPIGIDSANDLISFNNITAGTLEGIQSITRSDPENIKIINIPYSPSAINIGNDGEYEFDSLWSYDNVVKYMKLIDFSRRFTNSITTQADSILKYYQTDIGDNPLVKDTARYLKDSKLYHSDYFRPKFVYDSFSRVFPLEEINYDETRKVEGDEKFKFEFVMSRNIISKFLFKFNFVYNNPIEDYENVVAVSRNNEEVLYNSAYLNYIRNGYNYDLKAKERQEQIGGATLGISAAGFIASALLAATGVGAPVGIAGMIGTGLGLATSSINYARTMAQNEENIQKKLQDAQQQSIGVLNADDYDLLYSYSFNKAKLCTYKISDQMENTLDDLFYYFGYVENTYEKPTIDSRLWFNFVQCDLNCNTWNNIPQDIREKIKNKFAEGVTFFHCNTIDSVKTWDVAQEKENWETWLFA